MKRLIIWLPAVAILCVAIAAASSCTTTPASACNLDAPSATAAGAGCEAKWIDANIAINQLQSFGTHNSYKEKIPDVEMALINERLPKVGPTLDYEHRPFAEQLDKGARQIELDPSDDPQGGLYSTPLARKILTERGVALPAYDLSVMAKPGLKVIHVADIDYRSHCLLCRLLSPAGESLVRRASQPHAHPDDDQPEILGHPMGRRGEGPSVGEGVLQPHGR